MATPGIAGWLCPPRHPPMPHASRGAVLFTPVGAFPGNAQSTFAALPATMRRIAIEDNYIIEAEPDGGVIFATIILSCNVLRHNNLFNHACRLHRIPTVKFYFCSSG